MNAEMDIHTPAGVQGVTPEHKVVTTGKLPELADDQPQQSQPVATSSKKKPAKEHPRGIVGLVNRPWLLIAVAVLLGCSYLIKNPTIITDHLNTPYADLAGPIAVLSILAGWIVYKFFQSIVAGCKASWQALLNARKEDSSAQFFWAVIIVFMIVSVFTSGDFFTKLEQNFIPGLGYAVAFLIDLITVQSMRARMNAVRMRDSRGILLYTIGIVVCALSSTFANLYITLEHFHALPDWMKTSAPWFGIVFPGLILLLSITADYTVEQTSTKLDPDKYEELEEKRIRLLEVQRDMLKRRTSIEKEIDGLNGQADKKAEKAAAKKAKAERPRVPLINFSVFGQKVDQAQLVSQITSQVLNQVNPEPVDLTAIQSAIVSQIMPLIPASVPQIEPVNVDDLLTKMTPAISQIVARNIPPVAPPEPINYEQIAIQIAPLFDTRMNAMKASISEEIQSTIPLMTVTHAPIQTEQKQGKEPVQKVVQKVAQKVVQKSTRKTRPLTDEERLEAELQKMLSEGEKPTGRKLSESTDINRRKVNAWIKNEHPEYYVAPQNGKQENSSDERDEYPDLHHFHATPVPANSGATDGANAPLEERHSDELPAIILEPELVQVQ